MCGPAPYKPKPVILDVPEDVSPPAPKKAQATKRAKFVKEFTIDRSEWNPAEMFGHGELSGPGGKCCLGIYGDACNVSYTVGQKMPEEKTNQAWPKGLFKKYDAVGDNGEPDKQQLADLLADTNDDKNISQKWREQKIRQLFARMGVTVHFKGELPRKRKPKSLKIPPSM